MKLMAILAVIPALFLVAAGAPPQAGVAGGKHDFSSPHGDFTNACSACHVPHLQAVRPAAEPAEAALQMYRVAGQRRVFVPDRYTPGPSSLVCLGCHDGTVATSTIGSAHAILAGLREGFMAPEAYVLRDHPIGVPYPRDSRKYRPLAMVESEGKIPLPEGRIECVSCHDPHNESGVDKMLVMPNKRSRLCLSCHRK